MKKLFLILFVIFIVAQVASAQPTGPEVKWVTNVGYSSDAKFTQDDKYIVATDGGDLIVIDAENGKILRRCQTGSTRRQIKLSNNDTLIYSCGDDGIIYAHRFSDLEKVKEFRKIVDLYASSPVESFDISKNDSIIICSFGNPNLIFYDITKDSIYNTILTGIYCRNIYFFDNDSKFVVSYGGTASIYDTKTLTILSHTYGHDFGKWVTGLDISPDNTKIVTCGNDGKIYICDVETGKKLEAIPNVNDGAEVWGIKWLNNNRIIYGGGTGKIAIYDFQKKKIIYQINDEGATNFIETIFQNNFLIIGFSYDSYNYCLIDGDFITTVPIEEGKDKVIIYPSPVESIITIDLVNTSITNKINFSISDIQGIVVKSGIVSLYNGKFQLDVSGLQNGCYLLNLNLGNRIDIYKFIMGR
ncbi:MAG: T9SS type A sorting domain-containing protein [Bacteroidota bacterium]